MKFGRRKGRKLTDESVDLTEFSESEIDCAFVVGVGGYVALAEEERIGVRFLNGLELGSGRSGESDYSGVVAEKVPTA